MGKKKKSIKRVIRYFDLNNTGTERWVKMNPELEDELRDLMIDCGFEDDYKNFNNTAFTIMKWVCDTLKEGRIIASVDEEKEEYIELLMPFIEHIKANLREK